jgi:hypothetical protein
VGFVVRLSSQQTSDGVVVEGSLTSGNVNVLVVKSLGSEIKDVRNSLVGILLTQVSEIPVLFNSAESGEVYIKNNLLVTKLILSEQAGNKLTSIEGLIDGSFQVLGDSTQKKRPDLVSLGVARVLLYQQYVLVTQ